MPVAYLGTRDVPVRDLTPFPGNARRGNRAAIRASIQAHGQYKSLLVRACAEGLVVLAGNNTLAALVAEGYESARCEIVECGDLEARKINLADNRLSDLAVDDPDALVELLSYLDDDYAGTGFTETDVERLISAEGPPGDPVPDADPDLPGDPPGARSCPACGYLLGGS